MQILVQAVISKGHFPFFKKLREGEREGERKSTLGVRDGWKDRRN